MNIGGQDDEFNRYKMPSVIAKVEGRGNGIKTRIVNCYEVARALHRPPGYVCKFFGCELGAQTKIDDIDGTYIVNGSFQQNVLQDVLKKFIDMFVLCTSCNLPETDLKLRKGGVITQACNACGQEASCDMTHKLCTFIMNNPPDGKKKKSDGKKDKAARRAAKAKKSNGNSDDFDNGRVGKTSNNKDKRNSDDVSNGFSGADSTVMIGNGGGIGSNGILEEEEHIGMIGDFDFANDDHINMPSVGGDIIENDDDVEWSVDTSKEAEEARKRELGAAASILERGTETVATTGTSPTSNGGDIEEDDTEGNEKAMKLRAYMDDGKKASKVLSKAEKIFDDDAIRGLMMAATVNESLASIPESVKSRAIPVFEYIGKPMSKVAQFAFFDYLDWVGKNGNKNMILVLPHMLKVLYDSDVLEEKEIVKWFEDTEGPEEGRKAIQVIIDWLKEDDDDEESDD